MAELSMDATLEQAEPVIDVRRGNNIGVVAATSALQRRSTSRQLPGLAVSSYKIAKSVMVLPSAFV
jgi:hypothetical protein